MASARAGQLPLVLAGVVFLAACEPGQDFNLFGADQSVNAAGATTAPIFGGTIEQDVEAPDVFQVTDAGLWDGRPSLGGVWIAHPDVTDPERVIIRNQDNAKFIVGALFRRERENPGPRFQVSSDAAAELGMLAGSPATLSVVALRRVPVPVILEPEQSTEIDIEADIAADIAAAAVATIGAPEIVEAAPTGSVDPIASIAASAIEAATAKNPKASLPAATTAAQSALAATAAVVPVARPAVAPASALAKPFIQIGIYSVQSNADETSAALRLAGIIPIIKTSQKDGKSYWRILIGPISGTSERTQILSKVKGLGFSDAYAVTN